MTDDDDLVVTLTGAISAEISPDTQNLAENADCDNATQLVADESGTVTIDVSLRNGTGTGSFNFQIVDIE